MSDSRTEIEIPPTGQLPETEVGPPEHQERSPREVTMDRIAENAAAKREQELHSYDAIEQEAREAHLTWETADNNQFDADDGDEPTDRAPRQTQSSRQTQGRGEPAPELFAVEIQGQQYQVNRDQMVELAKMGMIARQTVTDYQQMQARQYQQQQQFQQPQPQQQQPGHDPILSTVRAVQYGTEEQGTVALRDLINNVVREQRVDPNAIAYQAAQQANAISARQKQEQEDNATIRREFAPIFEDPIRTQAAAQRVHELQLARARAGLPPGGLEVYREAGHAVMRSFGAGQAQSTRQGDFRVARDTAGIEARKRSAPRTTSAVLDTRSTSGGQPRAPTGADIVEQIRRSRGQA